MAKPIVAIVGRPNVGKSTLFNIFANSRISIVEDTPGVTRDRLYATAEWLDHEFMMVDTGGIEIMNADAIAVSIRQQAQIAIKEADVILFVCDARAGITTEDADVARLLRQSKKPIVLAVNKADSPKQEMNTFEFYNLGIGDPIAVSASNHLGLGDLLDAVVAKFPSDKIAGDLEEEDEIKVALIGRPNVGKSSIFNALVGEERSIVSDVAGTTRDAIDTPVVRNGQKYLFIDTAGMRRKAKVDEPIEKYSVMRSLLAVERADVCLILIDANEGVTEQDTKIAGEAHEAGKGIIIVVNKWDEYEKETGTLENYKKQVYNKLSYLTYAPIIFISAKTGQRVDKLFGMINKVANSNSLRIPTATLNQVINEAIAVVQPPTDKGKRLKILYATQAQTKPPTFVIFVNNKELFHFSYERYLVNQIRSNFDLEGTPVRIISREKREDK